MLRTTPHPLMRKLLWSSPIRIATSTCLALTCLLVIAFSYTTADRIAGLAIDGTESFTHEVSSIFADQATGIAIQRIVAQASLKAATVESRLSNAMIVATTLAESLGWTRESGPLESMSRDRESLRLKRLLHNQKDFAAVFSCWEPGMFDQQVKAYANRSGYDASGRFTSNWMRQPDGSIVSAPLTECDSEELTAQGFRRGDFNLIVKETLTPHFITLHPYMMNDKVTWLTTATAPIIVSGRFAGSVGVGFQVDFMHNLMLSLKQELFDGGADSFIISGTGHVAASTLKDISTGTHISTFDANWKEHLRAIQGKTTSAVIEGDKLVIVIPLTLTANHNDVAILITVPTSVIHTEATLLQDSLFGEMEVMQRTITGQRDTLILQQMGIGGALIVVTVITILLLRSLGTQSKALLENEARLQEILHNTSNLVIVTDLAGNVVFANPSFEHLTALPHEQITGRHINDLLPPDEKTRSVGDPSSSQQGIISQQWEEYFTVHGEPHTFLTTKFPLHDITGQPYGLCSIAVDISERMRSEQRILQMERYLTDIINSMPSIIIGLDENGAVRHWNTHATEYFAIDREAAIGQQLPTLVPDLADQWANARQTIASNSPHTTERTRLATSKGRIPARIVIYPLEREGKAEAVIRIDDMTAQARIEEVMIQTEKMMSVGGLAAGMAHEINNPLGAILQGAQNIERRLSPALEGNRKAAEEAGCSLESISGYMESRKILTMLKGIRDAGERAARIVQNMLNFARKSSSERSQHNLAELVDRTVEMARSDYDLKKSYDIKKVAIETDHEVGLPPIPCISTELEQVLLNLIKNAAQAMAMSGTENPVIRISSRKDGDWAVLTVADNGPGMPEATRKRAFEPFFTTKAPGIGTGLGLSVSYFIITENHEGSITVDSTSGQGTSFTIRLPLDSAQTETKTQQET
ncbi:PAS domain S-box protein [Desulfovibrio mangrovi]|uniref:PAS domain S-box protein n=1 Tax=Desulfovibrio mangrovi TaxID=2976983 RepID=UPI002245B7C9|nr:PAS domain S-box protein [Desulfovibrio mangrovi]UZP67163.1 PAS domain S-box protein [Desulfovibrio mangrovi]